MAYLRNNTGNQLYQQNVSIAQSPRFYYWHSLSLHLMNGFTASALNKSSEWKHLHWNSNMFQHKHKPFHCLQTSSDSHWVLLWVHRILINTNRKTTLYYEQSCIICLKAYMKTAVYIIETTKWPENIFLTRS